MFETVPIENSIADMAQKFKEILGKIFAPVKEAWDREGQFVMDSWKYALDEVWNLMKDIGRDFLTMWNQEATIQMFADILHIIGDIGQVVGNLAHNLDEAWNKNQIGLHILENIRDIFAIIIRHIRNAADYTVEWSKKLDFYPLLESVNTLLEALKPLADNVGAGLEWFWKNVLLPIAGWTIQDAVPAFLNLLSAAIRTVNEVTEALKPLGGWLFNTFLKPLGEWTGALVIAALKTITDLLNRFGDWISEHQGIVEAFTVVIGSFMAAWGIVDLAVKIGGIISAFAAFVTSGGLAAAAAAALGGAIAFLTSPITLAIAAIAAIIAAGILLVRNWDTVSAKAKELWDFVKQQFEAFERWLDRVFSADWEYWFGIFGGVIGGFMKSVENIWNGIKEIFRGITAFLSGVFTGDWKKAWEGVRQIFKGVFDSLVAIAKSPINIITGLVNGLVSGVVSGVNAVISALNKINVKVPDWVPKYGGKSFGFNLSKITTPRIPYLATGAVIPPNAPFLALMGEQKNGTNLEAPESLIRKIVREESGRNQQSGGTYQFTAMINRRVLFDEMMTEAQLRMMANGKNPYTALG